MKHIKTFESFLNEGANMEKEIEIKSLSDLDHTRIIKWLGDNINSGQYDLKKKSGKDYILDVSKALPVEIEDIKNYLTSQDYI